MAPQATLAVIILSHDVIYKRNKLACHLFLFWWRERRTSAKKCTKPDLGQNNPVV